MICHPASSYAVDLSGMALARYDIAATNSQTAERRARQIS